MSSAAQVVCQRMLSRPAKAGATGHKTNSTFMPIIQYSQIRVLAMHETGRITANFRLSKRESSAGLDRSSLAFLGDGFDRADR